MNIIKLLPVLLLLLFTSACNQQTEEKKPEICDKNMAMNKMLALNKVQSRVVAEGGEAGLNFSTTLAQESEPVMTLIREGRYQDACLEADKLEEKYQLDLNNEIKNMVTYEQLEKDSKEENETECTVGNAAIMQMELHADLKAEVDSGRMNNAIFRLFNEDTKGYAEMLSTEPSKACELFKDLRVKYGLVK